MKSDLIWLDYDLSLIMCAYFCLHEFPLFSLKYKRDKSLFKREKENADEIETESS